LAGASTRTTDQARRNPPFAAKLAGRVAEKRRGRDGTNRRRDPLGLRHLGGRDLSDVSIALRASRHDDDRATILVVDALDPDIVRCLARPEAHPDDPSAPAGIRWIQTHLSHVFLTRDRVAKLRKAADLSFVSFADRAVRNADCIREIDLNRRLAPDVYLGISEVEPVPTEAAVRYRLGPVQRHAQSLPEGSEHCVIMRRLPDDRDARSLVRAGALRPAEIDRVAARIARFHRDNNLGRPSPFTPDEWWERNWRPARENFQNIAAARTSSLDPAVTRMAAELTRQRFEACRERFETRRVQGRAVHGHGDLHLQHIWFPDQDAPPVIIDCVEFSEALRQIDGASEIAFLAMDLRFEGEPALAERALRRYASELDDFGLYEVVDLFVSYRAAVRAKVACLASVDPSIGREQRNREAVTAARYVDLAVEALAPRTAGPIVMVCGTVGSGKSTAAEILASEIDGALVSSDRIRKQTAGRAPDAATPNAELRSLYSRERVAAVYAAVLERARWVSRSGRPVVLDATFSRAEDRRHARALADELGSVSLIVELRCSADVATERTRTRMLHSRDASDAGPERVEPSRESFEPPGPDEWPDGARIVIETDPPDWRESLRERIRARLDTAAAGAHGRGLTLAKPS
jgi:aminoglycoside phosphotransferase family enzyme/predicted kinase